MKNESYMTILNNANHLNVNPEELSSSVTKLNLHCKKVLLSILWNFRGIIHYELLSPKRIITAEYY